jgi:hypothetical protein
MQRQRILPNEYVVLRNGFPDPTEDFEFFTGLDRDYHVEVSGEILLKSIEAGESRTRATNKSIRTTTEKLAVGTLSSD